MGNAEFFLQFAAIEKLNRMVIRKQSFLMSQKCRAGMEIGWYGDILISLLTQSKSKTQITKSVHCKFNCFTVVFDRTQHGIYII